MINNNNRNNTNINNVFKINKLDLFNFTFVKLNSKISFN